MNERRQPESSHLQQRSHLVVTQRWAAVTLRSAMTVSCIAIHMCMFGHPKPCFVGQWEGGSSATARCQHEVTRFHVSNTPGGEVA